MEKIIVSHHRFHGDKQIGLDGGGGGGIPTLKRGDVRRSKRKPIN